MTRKLPAKSKKLFKSSTLADTERVRYWRLQEARAQFGELVRRAQLEGPQHIALNSKESVVVISVDEFQRLTGSQTGAQLIEVMQSCPLPEIDLHASGVDLPVRDVIL